MVLEADLTSGEFYGFETYNYVHDRYLLQTCFEYTCVCEADNECPAEVLWLELDDDTEFYDTITRDRINTVDDGSYEFTSGSIIVENTVVLEASLFISEDNEFAIKIEMKGDDAVVELPVGYI